MGSDKAVLPRYKKWHQYRFFIFMNYHFLSFLFDVSIWVALSIGLGKLISDMNQSSRGKQYKDYSLLLLSALCTGFWTVMTHGLPEVGFAWYSFMVVLLVTLAHAVFLSPHLQVKGKQLLIISLAYATSLVKALKGGVIYGNSR